MEDFPSNSHTNRKPVAKPEPKKIDKVVEGAVVRRKKSRMKKFKDIFIGGDAKAAWAFVLMERFVPAMQDAFIDAGQEAIQRLIRGDSHSTGYRPGRRPGSILGHVTYNKPSSSYSRNTPRDGYREESRAITRRARVTHDFDEIILATRVEAEEVVDRLFDLVSKYELATVADLYNLVGITGDYTDDKWGWTDIRGAGVSRVTGGFLLDLPKPEPIE